MSARLVTAFLAAAVLGNSLMAAAQNFSRRNYAAAAQARLAADDVSSEGGGMPLSFAVTCHPRACFAAGPFTVTVRNADHVRFGYYHAIRLDLQFRNVSDHPLALVYRARSGKAADNLGNIYVGSDASLLGLPADFARREDPPFFLRPGESTGALFEAVGARTAAPPTSFDYDLTVEELGPGKPAPVLKEHAVSFRGIALRDDQQKQKTLRNATRN